jgi:hypothetical protein
MMTRSGKAGSGRARRLAAFVAVAILGIAGSARPAPAAAATPAGAIVLRCTNLESGASWTLEVDSANATVNGYKATVGQGLISWHNTQDQGFYTLDRSTGDLKVVRGSSMGGWELHALCRRE